MRALIIGFGSIGRRHTHNLRMLRPELSFVMLRHNLIENEQTRSLNAHVVHTLETALALTPDFAVVANPSALHTSMVEPLLEAGIPCYIEKPLVVSRSDYEQIRRVLDRLNTLPVTFSGCNLRMLPSLQKVRELLVSGKLGKVVRANLQVGQWLPDWRPECDYRKSYSASTILGGGVVFDLVHELDAVRWLLGDGFQVKGAVCGRFSRLEIDTDDTACILLGKNGCPPAVTVSLDYVSRRLVRRYEFVGEEATLVWDLPMRSLRWIGPEGEQAIAMDDKAFDMNETYVAAMREFLECIEAGRQTSQDIREGLRTAELAILVKEMANS